MHKLCTKVEQLRTEVADYTKKEQATRRAHKEYVMSVAVENMDSLLATIHGADVSCNAKIPEDKAGSITYDLTKVIRKLFFVNNDAKYDLYIFILNLNGLIF